MVALLSGVLEDLRSILRLSEDEARAMVERQVARDRLECPRCAKGRLYALRSRRRRCAGCRYTFGLFAGRWLSRVRIPARSWLIALKAFEAGLPAESLGRLAGLSRPTLYRVLNTIRLSLAAQEPRWKQLASGDAAPTPLLFGLRREGGRVALEAVDAAFARGLGARPPEEVHRDGIVFTAPHGRFASLLSDGRNALGRRGPEREASEPFLKFLKVQTSRHYGIPRKMFPLYLMEWELRFNRMGRPWFEELLRAITSRRS